MNMPFEIMVAQISEAYGVRRNRSQFGLLTCCSCAEYFIKVHL